ncbi:hypothetical protein T484DRAFT_2133442 [Baffinella frigidus]|nr:hypothetical protein T484DRAFT_2133442 [Cryptophyta sp. CCMP2293]
MYGPQCSRAAENPIPGPLIQNPSAEYSKIFGPDRKKNGFGTSDYPRRDEFSNTIRTEQMRDILKKEGKATKKAKKERESRTVALGTGSQILSNTGLDGSLPAPPLFDVIYRIPEASMRLARDDRQAALWYKSERKKMDAGEPRGEVVRPHITEPAWVNCAIAGRSYNVLVDVDGKVCVCV